MIKKLLTNKFTILSTLFCVCLIASNIFETKIFDAGPLTLTGGFLVFPIMYSLNDCLTEVYGYSKTRFTIILAMALNLFFVGMAQIVRILPEASYGEAQAHLDYIFAADLRITLASMLAFLFGGLINAKIMSRMRQLQGEKGFGWRAIVSSLAGESVDSLIFFPIAFFGIGWVNILELMVTQIILKTLYEAIVLPLTSLLVRYLKKS